MPTFVQIIRKYRLFLNYDPQSNRKASDFTKAAYDISWLIRFFYLFITYFFYANSKQLLYLGENIPTEPLWLIKIVGAHFFQGHSAFIIPIAYISTLLTAYFPDRIILRLSTFIIILYFAAYQNSFGSISHGYHFMIYVSFSLLFLPNNFNHSNLISRAQAMQIIAVFWLTQSILLLSYSLAGFFKISGGSLWQIDGLTRTVLNRAIQNGGSPFLWEKLLIDHWQIAEFFFIANIYIQFFSLLVLFRPNLHKPYGFIMILFHFGTYLLLHITFSSHIIIWGLFFVMSPMAPKQFSLHATLRSLPIFGMAFKH